jgi:hypothetical protein
MRHVLIAGLVAAVLTLPLCAQMRGGRGGSSGHSSFSPRGSGFASSGRSFSHSGPRFGGGFGGHFGNDFHRGFGDGFHGGFHGGFHSRFRSSFTFVGAFGYPYYGVYGSFGYPSYGGYWAPAYSYPAYSYPAYSYPEQNSGYTSDLDYSYQQKRNMEELDRLQDRVDRLEQRASASVPRPPQYEAQTKSSTPVILIFRDKHSQEVNNYAVVGETLWVFNEQRATRVPLSALDLDATRKANDERGVEFQVPTSR